MFNYEAYFRVWNLQLEMCRVVIHQHKTAPYSPGWFTQPGDLYQSSKVIYLFNLVKNWSSYVICSSDSVTCLCNRKFVLCRTFREPVERWITDLHKHYPGTIISRTNSSAALKKNAQSLCIITKVRQAAVTLRWWPQARETRSNMLGSKSYAGPRGSRCKTWCMADWD